MNKKTIDGIRQYYRLPTEISDDQIKQKLKNSFGEAIANLNIAKNNLIQACQQHFNNKIFEKFSKHNRRLNS